MGSGHFFFMDQIVFLLGAEMDLSSMDQIFMMDPVALGLAMDAYSFDKEIFRRTGSFLQNQ